LAFENRVLAFEKGVLPFENWVLAFETNLKLEQATWTASYYCNFLQKAIN
jgi:hypothetical protein